MKTFAERLKWAREQKGLSQRELADRAGVSAASIGMLESGARNTSRALLEIAEALGVDAAWLQHGKAPVTLPANPAPTGDAERWRTTARWVAAQAGGARITPGQFLRVVDFLSINDRPAEGERSQYVAELLKLVGGQE